jgi:hypothetical protein
VGSKEGLLFLSESVDSLSLKRISFDSRNVSAELVESCIKNQVISRLITAFCDEIVL